MRSKEMLQSHPRKAEVDRDVLASCVEACFACAQTCTSCADACLGGEQPALMTRCIRLNLDCADVCAATGRITSRLTEPNWTLVRGQVEACRTACRACADECEKHAEHEAHCRICAETCRRCEQACERLRDALPAA